MPPYYLLDHPPARKQFYTTRRESPSGVIVIHCAENVVDVDPPDTGAEAVAKFISNRMDAPGSYHTLADSDSILPLMPLAFTAFHDGTGTNAHSIGISGAFRVEQWNHVPEWWRKGCVDNMAKASALAAGWVYATRGIVVPARFMSAAEARRRIPGFTSHQLLDPGRRSDPGRNFYWDYFLDRYKIHMGQQEDFWMSDEAKRALGELKQDTAKIIETLNQFNTTLHYVPGGMKDRLEKTQAAVGRLDALFSGRSTQGDIRAIAKALVDAGVADKLVQEINRLK